MKRCLPVLLIGKILFWATPVSADFLNVTPPIVEVSARPGSVVRGKLTVTNMEEFSAPLQVEVQMSDSKMPDEGALPPASNWLRVKVSPHLMMFPRAPRVIRYQIDVPKDLVGEKMAHVFFSLNPPEEGGQGVGMLMRVGIPICLTAKGTEKGEIFPRKFSAILGQDRRLQFDVDLELVGNAHVRPRGEWTISEKDELEIERVSFVQRSSLFPGQIKGFMAKSDRSWPSGTYSVRLTVTYGETWGEKGQPFMMTKNFQMTVSNDTAQLTELGSVP